MKRFVLLTLVGLFFAGCSEEFHPEDMANGAGVSAAFPVSEAKSMFESSVSEIDEVTDAFLCSGDFTPLWDDARYTEVSGREYYDVPILPTYKYKVLNSSFVRGRSVVSRDEVYQKLVVMKTSSSASGVYVVSLIPASDNGARLSGLCPGQVEDSGFSGTIVYSDLASGSLVRVNVYESGHKVYGVYVPAVRSYEDLWTALNERLCALSLYRYSSVLTKYDGGEIEPSYCYPEPEPEPEPDPDPYESPYGEEEPPADPEPEDDDTSEGQESINQGVSGTTTPVNPPPSVPPVENGLGSYPYVSSPTDKFARENIPSTTDLQVPSWCVYASMSYISGVLGDGYNQLDYRRKFSNMKGDEYAGADGVPPADFAAFVNTCFDATGCNIRQDIIAALDSGNVVLVCAYVSADTAHAVTIVGYADDGTFIYMDTETGILYNENTDNLLDILDGYSISGYKEL